MADHHDNADEDLPSKRETHYSAQRSSYRSSLNSNKSSAPPPIPHRSRSTLHRLDDFELDLGRAPYAASSDRADSDVLSSSSPAPNVPYTRSGGESSARKKRRSSGRGTSRSARSSRAEDVRESDNLSAAESWLQLYDMNAHSPMLLPPLQTPRTREQSRQPDREHGSLPPSRGSRAQRSRQGSHRFAKGPSRAASTSQLSITALPSLTDAKATHSVYGSSQQSKRTPQAKMRSRYTTELYTVSYLIFFAIWGTLARLGLQALTFYPGAPLSFSELWANVAGTFIMGFLAEDRQLFRPEWGDLGEQVPEPPDKPVSSVEARHASESRVKARHSKIKKTIPLYIGLATGFCGSFTSFSSFARDVFLSLSNDLRSPINHPYPANTPIPSVSTTVARNGGHSFMAICATVIITMTVCYSALKVGAHLALLLDPLTPTLSSHLTRRYIDPVIAVLAWGMWLGAVLLSVFPPHNAWRGQALFACVFAPIGCLVRYYASIRLNPIIPSFPLGTFTANIFGTAVLGMAYDIQHVQLRGTGLVGGSIISCQVLQGIMDGFCGALTTVSTWILEIDTLKRRHGYIYGSLSVVVALGLLVIIMGSVRWTVGWSAIICTT
ncbi:CrcB-like protein-domain-containing protein [Pyrenochaeta sp. MPI-SDFR-AT-0127]|nr:CrcB-like protein-domain-containing protein [Pyrenochaeta sp. MPI-SDFR-AT-0127]